MSKDFVTVSTHRRGFPKRKFADGGTSAADRDIDPGTEEVLPYYGEKPPVMELLPDRGGKPGMELMPNPPIPSPEPQPEIPAPSAANTLPTTPVVKPKPTVAAKPASHDTSAWLRALSGAALGGGMGVGALSGAALGLLLPLIWKNKRHAMDEKPTPDQAAKGGPIGEAMRTMKFQTGGVNPTTTDTPGSLSRIRGRLGGRGLMGTDPATGLRLPGPGAGGPPPSGAMPPSIPMGPLLGAGGPPPGMLPPGPGAMGPTGPPIGAGGPPPGMQGLGGGPGFPPPPPPGSLGALGPLGSAAGGPPPGAMGPMGPPMGAGGPPPGMPPPGPGTLGPMGPPTGAGGPGPNLPPGMIAALLQRIQGGGAGPGGPPPGPAAPPGGVTPIANPGQASFSNSLMDLLGRAKNAPALTSANSGWVEPSAPPGFVNPTPTADQLAQGQAAQAFLPVGMGGTNTGQSRMPALLGGRPYKKGGFANTDSTAEGLPPAPPKKGKAAFTRKPKGPAISIAIAAKKKPDAAPSPYDYEDTAPAPPPAPPMAKGGAATAKAKGGEVAAKAKGGEIKKAKGGECDDKMAKGGPTIKKKTGGVTKLAAGGAAKQRRGFPNTSPPKRLAAGGKVRGCGAAVKGCTFSGCF